MPTVRYARSSQTPSIVTLLMLFEESLQSPNPSASLLSFGGNPSRETAAPAKASVVLSLAATGVAARLQPTEQVLRAVWIGFQHFATVD